MSSKKNKVFGVYGAVKNSPDFQEDFRLSGQITGAVSKLDSGFIIYLLENEKIHKKRKKANEHKKLDKLNKLEGR